MFKKSSLGLAIGMGLISTLSHAAIDENSVGKGHRSEFVFIPSERLTFQEQYQAKQDGVSGQFTIVTLPDGRKGFIMSNTEEVFKTLQVADAKEEAIKAAAGIIIELIKTPMDCHPKKEKSEPAPKPEPKEKETKEPKENKEKPDNKSK